MQGHSTAEFAAIKVAGGLLPTDYLKVVSTLEAPKQTADDYGLSPRNPLAEELLRFWQTAITLYSAKKHTRGKRNRSGSTRARHFLEYVLGYDDIEPVGGVELDGRSFALSHMACDGAFPMMLVPADYDLDRPEARFSANGKRMTPHRVVQDYLNAERRALWGMVSNGSRFRILRDNPSLTSPAYLEVDLEQVFAEDLFPEFRVFWLSAHASRFRPTDSDPSTCIFEGWRSNAQEYGERAHEKLRIGVANALEHLGTGFLAHPANHNLRGLISSRKISEQAYFAELLRLVYRLLFLFTAEERDLLHEPDVADTKRAVYRDGFSLHRLRERARWRRNYDHHSDLWEGLQIVFGALDRGVPGIGIPALGGLFRSDFCLNLDKSTITNSALLQAIRELGYLPTESTLARVNYADLDIEELGSIYESLLELHPTFEVRSTHWKFTLVGIEAGTKAKGSKKKLTGSYYTPDSLVQELIRTTLVPVLDKAKADNPDNMRAAILDLRIIDPACGSGHFLLAAANRLAIELVMLEPDSEGLGLEKFQQAIRDVLQYCIFGVDKNPFAVDLCKAALWMAAVEPGKPLTFLDYHIRNGDSLVGIFRMEDIDKGIPNSAYAALIGDDKALCTELKRANKPPSNVMEIVFGKEETSPIADAQLEFHFLPEDSLSQVAEKREAWETRCVKMMKDVRRWKADLFVSAFVAQKGAGQGLSVPISRDLGRISTTGIGGQMEKNVHSLRERHKFFHWHLEFADIMDLGGFDVVLANPPWERFKIQEKEFFAVRDPKIAAAPNKAKRNKLIEDLKREDAKHAESTLYHEFKEAKRKAVAIPHFARNCGRFPLTGKGDLNNYPLFAELCLQLLNPTGRAGLVVPTGIATDHSTRIFFSSIVDEQRLVSLYDFENRQRLFPGVHSSYKFCLLTLAGGTGERRDSEYAFYLRQPHQLKEEERRIIMTRDDFGLFNPNTRTCPTFRTERDLEIARKMYRRAGVLWRETRGFEKEQNPWGIQFSRMFDMSNDSGLFHTREELESNGWVLKGNVFSREDERYLPLYEAKLFHQYDHRFATFDGPSGLKTRDIVSEEKTNPSQVALPRYWVPEIEVVRRLGAPPPPPFTTNSHKPGQISRLAKKIGAWLAGDSQGLQTREQS